VSKCYSAKDRIMSEFYGPSRC